VPGLKHPMLRITPVSDELYAVSDLDLVELSRKRIWLWDLEATGLDTSKERVTQIAGCMFENGQVRDETAFVTFVWPGEGVEIPKVVQELTGITLDKLAGAPALPEAWRSHLVAAQGADFWLGQSVFEFDVPLLDAEFARHRMASELPAILDSKFPIIARIVQMVGPKRVKPSVYFNPMAQPTSNSPARTRIIQAICLPSGRERGAYGGTRSGYGRLVQAQIGHSNVAWIDCDRPVVGQGNVSEGSITV
jgi:hypothetical protein